MFSRRLAAPALAASLIANSGARAATVLSEGAPGPAAAPGLPGPANLNDGPILDPSLPAQLDAPPETLSAPATPPTLPAAASEPAAPPASASIPPPVLSGITDTRTEATIGVAPRQSLPTEKAGENSLGARIPPGAAKTPINPKHRVAKFLKEFDQRLGNLEAALGGGNFTEALRANLSPEGGGPLEQAARHVLLDALTAPDWSFDHTLEHLRRGGTPGRDVADRLDALDEALRAAPARDRWPRLRAMARLRRAYLGEGERTDIFNIVAGGYLGQIFHSDYAEGFTHGLLNPTLLSHPFLLTPNGKPTAASAVRALLDISNDQHLNDLREMLYPLSYVFVAPGGALTLHAYRSRSSIADLDISRVVLELPAPGTPTLWDQLDENQREILVFALQEIFRRGRYTEELNRAPANDEQVLWKSALLAAYLADLPLPEGWDPIFDQWPDKELLARQKALFQERLNDREKNGPLGISPRRLLLAAFSGIDIGVCRHINQALIGLLLELGAPADQLQLVAGGEFRGKNAERHLFGKVQLVKGGPWLEVDGTPGLRKDPRPLSRRYRFRRRTFPSFFRPIPVRPRSLDQRAPIIRLYDAYLQGRPNP